MLNFDSILENAQRRLAHRTPAEGEVQRYCAVCNAPLLDHDHFGMFAQLRRAKFQFDDEGEVDEVNVKAELDVCERCWLEDPDLCRFFNKIGWRMR